MVCDDDDLLGPVDEQQVLQQAADLAGFRGDAHHQRRPEASQVRNAPRERELGAHPWRQSGFDDQPEQGAGLGPGGRRRLGDRVGAVARR